MNMLVKPAEVECRGPLTKSGVHQNLRSYHHQKDLMVTTTSVPGCRWILQGLVGLIAWARMWFKPAKSRALVLKQGKVMDKFCFSLGGIQILSITEKPVRSLGKVFDCTLNDTASLQSTRGELESWLMAVDKSGLPGKFKA
ncbi:hypothetical protein LDENG_00083870 [Lucifuga dentata]|nr:hypothetical protein LDENG_00083870 [Lucifuga dentata]